MFIWFDVVPDHDTPPEKVLFPDSVNVDVPDLTIEPAPYIVPDNVIALVQLVVNAKLFKFIGPERVSAPDVETIVLIAVNSIGIVQVDAEAFDEVIAPVPPIFILPQLESVLLFKSNAPVAFICIKLPELPVHVDKGFIVQPF